MKTERVGSRRHSRFAIVAVGAAIVGAWVVAGHVEDRVSGDGKRSPLATAQRVRPYDPAQPAAEFHVQNASAFRVPSPRTSVERLLGWSFAPRPVPPGWKRLGIRRAISGAGGAALATNAASYEVQLKSPLMDVSAGDYEVVLDGDVARGGLQLLVLTSTGEDLARGLYWSDSRRKSTERMTIDFRLEAPARLALALANWSVEGETSSWELRRLTLFGRSTSASLVPDKPLPLRAELANVINSLRSAASSTESTWERAMLVRDGVRDALPRSDSPADVAAAMWAVSSHLNLPVRLARTAPNALNEFDAYATTEVWLAQERRWVVVDAYFGGHWTQGRNGVPLGIAEIAPLVRAGRTDEIFWHGAPATRSPSPTRHYLDPLQLHAHFAVLMQAAERHVYVTDTDVVPAGVTAYRGHERLDLSTAHPDEPGLIFPSAVLAGPATKRLPPSVHRTGRLRYADEVLLDRKFRPEPVRGRSRMTIVLDEVAYGYVTVTPPHAFTLTTGGQQYELAETTDGRMISPVVLLYPTMTLSWRNLRARQLTVRAWSAKRFPADREITSAIPPVDG